MLTLSIVGIAIIARFKINVGSQCCTHLTGSVKHRAASITSHSHCRWYSCNVRTMGYIEPINILNFCSYTHIIVNKRSRNEITSFILWNNTTGGSLCVYENLEFISYDIIYSKRKLNFYLDSILLIIFSNVWKCSLNAIHFYETFSRTMCNRINVLCWKCKTVTIRIKYNEKVIWEAIINIWLVE